MRPSITPRQVFLAAALVIALALPLLSFDFGITEDERLHDNHGQSILDYFLGRSDLAARDPLDPSGKLTFVYDERAIDLSGALNIYGGFFDLLCAAVQRSVSPLGPFETRHCINALFGVVLILCTGLVAARVAGWGAGVLALLLAVLSPRLVGHSMNNPVDVPFAALYMLSLYYMLRFLEELPRPSCSTWLPLLVVIPLATDVRIAGLVLLFYLGLFVGIWCVPRLRGRAPGDRRAAARALGLTAELAAGSYLLTSVLWPLAHRNPLTTPFLALRRLSRLETFNAYELFEGRWINRWEIPWYFVPKWLLIGTPLFVPLGLLLGLLLLRGRPTDDRRPAPAKVLLVAFTCLFPVVFVILRRSNVYNDARHVFFAYPPLLVFCAVAFVHVWRSLPQRLPRAGFALLLGGTLLEPLHFIVRNHPNEVVYFSPLIGGVDGAWMRYETDFWGNSVRQAVEWILANVTPPAGRSVRVRLWYGDQTKAAYYLDQRPGFQHVVADLDTNGWDYWIATTVESKYFPQALSTWPPVGTVYEVRADHTPLCAVLMNVRGNQQELLERARAWADKAQAHADYYTLASMYAAVGRADDAVWAFKKAAALPPEPVGRTRDEYLTMSRRLHEAGAYAESIIASDLALKRDPECAAAYDNLCAAYTTLGRSEDARRACERALALGK